MSAQHITQDTRFERAQMALGSRMTDPDWLEDAWGTQAPDDLCKKMCAALADGDDAQAAAILRNALKTIAERQVSKEFGVFL
jgi:hypothetical protein